MKTLIASESSISCKCIFILSTVVGAGFIIFPCQHMIEGSGCANCLLYCCFIVSRAQWLKSWGVFASPKLLFQQQWGPRGVLNFDLNKIAIRKRGDSLVFNKPWSLLISQNYISNCTRYELVIFSDLLFLKY